MNAPVRTDHLVQPTVELLPLTAIAVSETLAQQRRREEYDPRALDELARSIAENGLMHPVVVRPLEALRGLAKYELIAGERRFLAVQKLEQAHILARIVDASAEQIIKLQMVENLHRERLSTLAEAQGYKELVAGGMKAEAIADAIGKSRSYVYARIKLLELAAPVQEALKSGEIGADQALLFARIPTAKLQEVALSTLRKWDYQGHGEKLSFRRTAEILGEKAKGILIPLAQAPWQLDDETFWSFGPKDSRGAQDANQLPSCAACPKRSGNDPELHAALGDANVCTDKECYDLKAKWTFERRRKEVQASGREVLTGDDAAALMPTQFGTRGWIDLDSVCDDDHYPEDEPEQAEGESDEAFEARLLAFGEKEDNYQPRTYRQILGTETIAGLEIKLVQDPKRKGHIRELAPDKDVIALLKDRGIGARLHRDTRKPAPAPQAESPEQKQRREEREARERAELELEQKVAIETQAELLKRFFAAWRAPLKRDDLELVAEALLDHVDHDGNLALLYPKRPQPATMSERDLARLIVASVVVRALDDSWRRDHDKPLKAVCKRLKIDPSKVEKEVRAELAPKPEKAAPAKKAQAKKKAKR